VRCVWFVGAACCATVLALAVPAQPQVNTEILRKRIKLAGYSAIVEGAVTGDVGNTQGISVGAGLGGGWAKAPHLFFAYGRFDYSKYAAVTSVNKTFAHARYNYEFERWFWGEAFAQAQTDQFQRLDARNLFGVGPRARVAHLETFDARARGPAAKTPLETFDVFLGTAYMFERDAISPVAGATGPENQTIQVWHRWSSYVTVQWQIDPRAVLATTIYAQPVFNMPQNVRILSDTLLTFRITKVFSAGIAASIRYDSEPPTGVLPADVEVRNTLAVTF
jgi:putative salt-induced outer membrane protein YdiY